MFYRQHKTFWYQFCNLKHFLKAENSEDTQSETELLLELPESLVFSTNVVCVKTEQKHSIIKHHDGQFHGNGITIRRNFGFNLTHCG